MTDSNRVTELNQRSLTLTDAELAYVDRFSVLLPMNELPEIVVSGDQSDPDDRQDDIARTIIPFPAAIGQGRGGNSLDRSSDEIESSGSARGKKGNDSTGESAASRSGADAVTVEFPQDELSISRNSAENESSSEDAESDSENGDSEEAVFDIAEQGRFHQRLDSVAQNVENNLSDSKSNVLVMASPCDPADQDSIFNSLIMALATRNPAWRIIAIQGIQPKQDVATFSVGLGHVLSDEYLLEDVVIPTNVENLDYLAYSPCDLSNSSYRNRIGHMLDELKKHYDLVFINGNEASSPTTQGLADSADAFYLVVRMVDAEQQEVVNAVDLLRRNGARLAGCILSDYEREAS